jgi:hypothetical protein
MMLWVAVTAGFFLGGTATGAVTFNSPVGQWDFTVTGEKQGTLFLDFADDNTVTGYILVIPGTLNSKKVVSYGFAWLAGEWQFDQKGNVDAFLYNDPSETVRLDVTTFTGKVKTSKGVAVSFSATGQNEDGNLSFSGVPSVAPTATLPGVWTIEKEAQGNVIFTEIFSAQQATDTNGNIVGNGNLYLLLGEAADLCVMGYGSVSKRNNFYVNIWEVPMPALPSTCADIDFATAAGEVVSTAIGKISIKTDAFDNATGSATLSGITQTADTAAKGTKISMPVFCQ